MPTRHRDQIPKYTPVTDLVADDVAVWVERDEHGQAALVMSRTAYKCFQSSEVTPASPAALYLAFIAMQKLDAACRELAALPEAEIALVKTHLHPNKDDPKYIAENIIALSFGRARADVIRATMKAKKASPPPPSPAP